MSDAPVPNGPTASPDEALLVQGAWAYYVAQQDPGDIARRLGVSRATVSPISTARPQAGWCRCPLSPPAAWSWS